MAEAYGSTSCTSSLVPESKLSHRSESQYGFVPKLNHHGGKTEKTRVVMAGLVRELAHRHKAMTATRKFEKLRHQKRGF